MLVAALLAAYLPARLPAQDTIPTGYGTLRRDDVAVRITTDRVDIQVLPLREGIIRLLAPDTYRSLAELVRKRQATIDSVAMQVGVQRPTLVLVTFVGLLPQARFNPEDVNLASGGQLFRPVGIAPTSATCSRKASSRCARSCSTVASFDASSRSCRFFGSHCSGIDTLTDTMFE